MSDVVTIKRDWKTKPEDWRPVIPPKVVFAGAKYLHEVFGVPFPTACATTKRAALSVVEPGLSNNSWARAVKARLKADAVASGMQPKEPPHDG
jgi:hypothetical protein